MKRTLLLLVCLLFVLSACDPPSGTNREIIKVGDPSFSSGNCQLQLGENAVFGFSGDRPEGGKIVWKAVQYGYPDEGNERRFHYKAAELGKPVIIEASIVVEHKIVDTVTLPCTVVEKVVKAGSPATSTSAPTALEPSTPAPPASPSAAVTPTRVITYASKTPENPHGADDPPDAKTAAPTSPASTAVKPTAVQVVSVPPSDTPEPPPTDTPPPPPPTNTPCRDNRDGCKK